MCHYIDQGWARVAFYTFVMTKLLTVSCLHEFPVPQRESQPSHGLQQSLLLSHLYKNIYKYMVFFSYFTFISSLAFLSPQMSIFFSKKQLDEARSVFDPMHFAAHSFANIPQ